MTDRSRVATIAVSADLHQRLTDLAAKEGRSFSREGERMLEYALPRFEKEFVRLLDTRTTPAQENS